MRISAIFQRFLDYVICDPEGIYRELWGLRDFTGFWRGGVGMVGKDFLIILVFELIFELFF
jgi:hypothetical protein